MPRPFTVPAELVPEMTRVYAAGLLAMARSTGARTSATGEQLLAGLYAAAHSFPPPEFDSEPAPAQSSTVEVDVAKAAYLLGCTPKHVRSLVRSGRIAGRRIGQRIWAIDLASLDHWRFRGRTTK